DREQTIASLRPYLLEEASEVSDAIEDGDLGSLSDELGDLLLQIVFLSELGRREAAFGLDDVARGLIEKMVRRHPHVFSNAEAETSSDVAEQWEAIKSREKLARPLLDNIPRSFPALAQAERIGERVKGVGFDWSTAEASLAKVREEEAELQEALERGELDHVEEEFGDLLNALENWGRKKGLSAEVALQRTNQKFRRRFDHVEMRVRQEHGGWPVDQKGRPGAGLELEELDAYWDEAKAKED
ncbi:MAG: nucleoside triphosphate pyrophosphohydrolase, partial [Polyangiaceae bacterium]|nr:nucleoside triphosphate pyrophosphohydrolase [Polyangiaceae bacterium]